MGDVLEKSLIHFHVSFNEILFFILRRAVAKFMDLNIGGIIKKDKNVEKTKRFCH